MKEGDELMNGILVAGMSPRTVSVLRRLGFQCGRYGTGNGASGRMYALPLWCAVLWIFLRDDSGFDGRPFTRGFLRRVRFVHQHKITSEVETTARLGGAVAALDLISEREDSMQIKTRGGPPA